MTTTSDTHARGRALLAPWQRLSTDAASVIGLRLMALPWQMMLMPAKGQAEIKRMFSEKQSALAETQFALMMAPAQYWTAFMSRVMLAGPHAAVDGAIAATNASIIDPSRKRVRRNLKRLRRD